MSSKNNFKFKIESFILEHEKLKKNISILEFGVREGRSTEMFLEMCKNNGGKLISVDIDDYSRLFEDNNWTFLKSRDDNIEFISKYINEKLDIILIDSLHEPDHVIKLIQLYWKHLKLNGSIYIDDISWVPYVKGNWRDHAFTENINYNTFQVILNLLNSNNENFILEFNFIDSGIARLKKINEIELSKPKNIKIRKNKYKNYFKKIINFFKKN